MVKFSVYLNRRVFVMTIINVYLVVLFVLGSLRGIMAANCGAFFMFVVLLLYLLDPF